VKPSRGGNRIGLARRYFFLTSGRSTGRACFFDTKTGGTMKIRMFAVTAAALVVGVAAAACGSGSSSSAASAGAGTSASGTTSARSSGYGSGGGSSAAATGAVTLKAASSMLGTILVDQDGKTLYLFEADAVNKSDCSGGCATVWPPITMSGTATAGSGVSAKLISTTIRPDGSSQVTYAGHPLYWYEGDSNPGDTHGEGLTDFGGSWNAVSPAGKAV
jgi:predicted lipoprotein with Yx(FWY)xxD motif